MLPLVEDMTDLEVETQPSLTWKFLEKDSKLGGMLDGAEAVKQAVYCILNTERYENLIYPWEYGAELQELIGEPLSYALPELKRRITEAITQDDRIESVDNFKFDTSKKGSVLVSFTVYGNYGEIDYEKEVSI